MGRLYLALIYTSQSVLLSEREEGGVGEGRLYVWVFEPSFTIELAPILTIEIGGKGKL